MAALFAKLLERLPEGEAHRKLEGALTWNEIEINRSHVDELLPVLNRLPAGAEEPESHWVTTLIQSLREIVTEPAMYLMVKMRE